MPRLPEEPTASSQRAIERPRPSIAPAGTPRERPRAVTAAARSNRRVRLVRSPASNGVAPVMGLLVHAATARPAGLTASTACSWSFRREALRTCRAPKPPPGARGRDDLLRSRAAGYRTLAPEGRGAPGGIDADAWVERDL